MSLRKLHVVAGVDGSAVKYYGKWPFQRVLGMQEVFSVVFSLANLAAHAHNLRKLQLACDSISAATAGYSVQTLCGDLCPDFHECLVVVCCISC